MFCEHFQDKFYRKYALYSSIRAYKTIVVIIN